MNQKPLIPEQVTVIDDGQFRYPVNRQKLIQWEEKNEKITPATYEQFCSDVEMSLPDVLPGSAEMISVCDALLESGATLYRPA